MLTDFVNYEDVHGRVGSAGMASAPTWPYTPEGVVPGCWARGDCTVYFKVTTQQI